MKYGPWREQVYNFHPDPLRYARTASGNVARHESLDKSLEYWTKLFFWRKRKTRYLIELLFLQFTPREFNLFHKAEVLRSLDILERRHWGYKTMGAAILFPNFLRKLQCIWWSYSNKMATQCLHSSSTSRPLSWSLILYCSSWIDLQSGNLNFLSYQCTALDKRSILSSKHDEIFTVCTSWNIAVI